MRQEESVADGAGGKEDEPSWPISMFPSWKVCRDEETPILAEALEERSARRRSRKEEIVGNVESDEVGGSPQRRGDGQVGELEPW